MRDRAEKSVGEGEVSCCVANLILAFTDGLNVFKRLRERRRKRKSRQKDKDKDKDKEKEDGPSGEELMLSESLKKGPLELKDKYEDCYGDKGDRFAKGDAIAHASLVETLIKFNTGLVRIIASFLHHDSKNTSLRLDYKSLTHLSDASRREALSTMSKLHHRLSLSQLQLTRISDPKPDPEKKRRSSSRQRSQGPTVTRVAVKSPGHTTQTQLAMVRPRAASRRTSISSSTSTSHSSRTGSTRTPSPSLPPRSPPLPEYTPSDPYPSHPAFSKPAVPLKKPHLSSPSSRSKPSFTSTLPTPPEYVTINGPPYLPLPFSTGKPVARRRMEKETVSTYTFASDSTKLGEIPQRKWVVPFDFEEAARLNEEVVVKGREKTGGEQKRGRRLRGLFGK